MINRRQFIQAIATLSASLPLEAMASNNILGQENNAVYRYLTDPWLTLAVVQEHLLPADGTSPGAQDIMALRYLRNNLDAPDTSNEQRKFIIDGVGWLNDLSQQDFQLPFIQLTKDNKEIILRQVERSRVGSRWLSRMMTYLIEALLSDPVYGGNKNQLGWQWLHHIPGYPRPSVDNVYFKVGGIIRRRTKA